MLQSLGRASSAFARLIVRQIAPSIPGFAERVSGPGIRVLDVVVGVGALAIAFAEQLPHADVVGLDVWDPRS